MGEDGVSYVFKWESSTQLPQSPFPQVTTEEASKAVVELALLSQLPTPTLHQYTAAPRSNHLLSLPSVEDQGAEALSAGPSRRASHSRSSRHLPYTSTSRPSASVRRQETGRCQDSFRHLRQPFRSDSRINAGSRPSSQAIARLARSVPWTPVPSLVVTTDASSTGWGLQLSEGSQAQGLWTPTQSAFQINAKELIVALLFLQRFPKIQNTPILFRMDNQVAVQCIRRQGSSHSLLLLSITEELFDLAAARQLNLTASYLPGRDNDAAKSVSQTKDFQREDSAGCSLMESATLVPTTPDMVSISSTPQSPGPGGERNESLRIIIRFSRLEFLAYSQTSVLSMTVIKDLSQAYRDSSV
ncbi:hypothetical protein Pcinc_000120 [Petrolisthes cinctipes]|uniref:Reverse transcriptase RNase H-like domain-containing protein n=1 Tax=Petrolisthes cinctipes TaxID=88211 RepID=A0AAE1L525_PETCI|nr:hypothetical protein Pcinc_000120 [Petrolisthes cinctipes]